MAVMPFLRKKKEEAKAKAEEGGPRKALFNAVFYNKYSEVKLSVRENPHNFF